MPSSSVVPCLLILPLCIGLPESPLWLCCTGAGRCCHRDRATLHRTRRRAAGPGTRGTLPYGCWSQLLSPRWWFLHAGGMHFLHLPGHPHTSPWERSSRECWMRWPWATASSAAWCTTSRCCSFLLGLLLVDRMPRRTFLVGSFAITATAMLVLIVLDDPGPVTIIVLFAVFGVRALRSVEPLLCLDTCQSRSPPTSASSGIGLAIAASRIGSAASTFLLPVVVASMGVRAALTACFVVLATGGIVCYVLAPRCATSSSTWPPEGDVQEDHAQARLPAVPAVFDDGVFGGTGTAALRQSTARSRTLPVGDHVAGWRCCRGKKRHPDRGGKRPW